MSYPLVIRLMLATGLMPDASYCEALARLSGLLTDIPLAQPDQVRQPRVRQHRAVPSDNRGGRHHRAAEHGRLARPRHAPLRRDRHAVNPQASGPEHDRSRRGPGFPGRSSPNCGVSGRKARSHKGLL